MTPRSRRVEQSARPRTTRAFVLVLVSVLALTAAAFAGAHWRSRTVAAARLPRLPDLTGRPAAMVQHLVDADAAARRAPTSAAAVGGLGMAYHSDLFYEEAAAAYVLAAGHDVRDWRWTYYRALVHSERAEAGSAGEALKAVVTANPNHAVAWWRLGETLFKQGRYDEAAAAYERAEAVAMGDHGVVEAARFGRTRIATQRGAAAPAARSERRRVYAPHDPALDTLADISRSSVFLLRQAAAVDRSDSARRERLTRRALEVDPDNPDVLYEMGALLQQLQRPADALPYFHKHLTMIDDDQQTLVQIGKSYGDLARLDEAEKTLRQALALGDDAVGFYNLGVVLEQLERLAEAEAAYRRSVALGPGLARARNNLGALLARGGNLDEAVALLTESSRLDPDTPDAYTNLAAVMLQRGAFEEAVRYARLALEVAPRHSDAHVNLGVALAQLGRIDDARHHLQEALRFDPQHTNARRNLDALAARR